MSNPMPSGFQPSQYPGREPRRRHRTRNTVLAAVAAIIVVGGIASALGGGSGSGSGGKTVASLSTQPAAPVVAPTVDPPETTTPATTAPPKPKVLLDQAGSGILNTKPFDVTGPWTLKYSFDCSNFGSQGNFAVVVADNSGTPISFPVNALAASGNTSSQVYDTGTLHLEINSECSWHVTAVG